MRLLSEVGKGREEWGGGERERERGGGAERERGRIVYPLEHARYMHFSSSYKPGFL